eukprot:11228358-Lingulodinium_polyedra.AAC.1
MTPGKWNGAFHGACAVFAELRLLSDDTHWEAVDAEHVWGLKAFIVVILCLLRYCKILPALARSLGGQSRDAWRAVSELLSLCSLGMSNARCPGNVYRPNVGSC